jgi:hypothetical protein
MGFEETTHTGRIAKKWLYMAGMKASSCRPARHFGTAM